MRTILRSIRDFIELWLPALLLIVLFVVFIISIFCRYILRDPQSWTYEMESISFLFIAFLGACTAHRYNDHVVFDLFYTKATHRTQRWMRILSNVLIIVTSILLLPAAWRFMASMLSLKTQIMKLPRWLVFSCFPVLCLISALRSAIDLGRDLFLIKQPEAPEDESIERGSEK